MTYVFVSWSHGTASQGISRLILWPEMPSETVFEIDNFSAELAPTWATQLVCPSWAKRSAASSGSQPQRHETGLDVVRRAVQLQSFRPLWHNIRCFSFAPWSKMTIEVNQVHQDHLQGLQALSTGQLSQDKTGPSKSSAKAFLIGGASMRWVWQGGSNSPCRDGIALDGCNHAITLQSQPGSEMSRTCSFPSSKPVGTFQFG